MFAPPPAFRSMVTAVGASKLRSPSFLGSLSRFQFASSSRYLTVFETGTLNKWGCSRSVHLRYFVHVWGALYRVFHRGAPIYTRARMVEWWATVESRRPMIGTLKPPFSTSSDTLENLQIFPVEVSV